MTIGKNGSIRWIGLVVSFAVGSCSGNGNGTANQAVSGDNAETAPSLGGDGDTTPAPEPIAHVTAVAVSGDPGGYTFSVTVESADIDCTQYADWWEVVSQTGELLYRRILAHSHTDENRTGNPFTRDGGPVEVSRDQVVVVRAHMNEAGYMGRAMRGSIETGFTNADNLEPDFAADLEDDEPQPDGCLF